MDIEKEILTINSLQSWDNKLDKIKQIKHYIVSEKSKLNDYIDNITKDNFESIESNYSLDKLLTKFNNTQSIESKIKYYNMIIYFINQTNSHLFNKN
jgi:hypothetical protein